MEEKKMEHRPLLYPTRKRGAKFPVKHEVYALSKLAFRLAIDVRAFLEDIDGGRDFPHYLKNLKLRLLELLAELNLLLSYDDGMDETHFAALALEYGVDHIAAMSGPELVETFGLLDSFSSEAVDVEGVVSLFERLIAEFPGDIPDPLAPKGQRELLKALRNWDKICSAQGVDAKFLEDLLKEV